MRKLLWMAMLALMLAGVSLGWLVLDWQRFTEKSLSDDGGVMLWIAPGASYGAMVRQLEILGLTRADWRWRVLGRVRAPTLHAGEYLVESGTSVGRMLDQLERGDVRSHRFTIVEGWTAKRLRLELADDPRLRQVTRELGTDELMDRLGCAGCDIEGRFLPETYFFTRGTTDLELLRRSFAAMDRALSDSWANRSRGLPLDSPEELLVLASIVERETGQAGERARVAGVFVRRLERGMRLQTDPTVIYGLGDEFDGRIRYVHLRTDHPWNTYTRHGLPPTPIALPGRAALEAAAHPGDGTALYFVSRGDGTHHFSDTLAEHNAAVDRYIRGRQ